MVWTYGARYLMLFPGLTYQRAQTPCHEVVFRHIPATAHRPGSDGTGTRPITSYTRIADLGSQIRTSARPHRSRSFPAPKRYLGILPGFTRYTRRSPLSEDGRLHPGWRDHLFWERVRARMGPANVMRKGDGLPWTHQGLFPWWGSRGRSFRWDSIRIVGRRLPARVVRDTWLGMRDRCSTEFG